MLSFVKVAFTSLEMKMLVHIGMLPWTEICHLVPQFVLRVFNSYLVALYIFFLLKTSWNLTVHPFPEFVDHLYSHYSERFPVGWPLTTSASLSSLGFILFYLVPSSGTYCVAISFLNFYLYFYLGSSVVRLPEEVAPCRCPVSQQYTSLWSPRGRRPGWVLISDC